MHVTIVVPLTPDREQESPATNEVDSTVKTNERLGVFYLHATLN